MEDTLRHRFTLLATLVTALVTIPFAAPASASPTPPPNPQHHHHHHGHGPGGGWGHGQSDDQGHTITFKSTLTGWNELPHGAGDRNAGGTAVFELDPHNQLCYVLSTYNISGRITAAHIHLGNNTKEGPIFVTLAAPSFGEVHTCQQVTTRVAGALNEEPTNFYVNVHSSDYPDGAIRGQLQRG
jgi:hypothetical protein